MEGGREKTYGQEGTAPDCMGQYLDGGMASPGKCEVRASDWTGSTASRECRWSRGRYLVPIRRRSLLYTNTQAFLLATPLKTFWELLSGYLQVGRDGKLYLPLFYCLGYAFVPSV